MSINEAMRQERVEISLSVFPEDAEYHILAELPLRESLDVEFL